MYLFLLHAVKANPAPTYLFFSSIALAAIERKKERERARKLSKIYLSRVAVYSRMFAKIILLPVPVALHAASLAWPPSRITSYLAAIASNSYRYYYASLLE